MNATHTPTPQKKVRISSLRPGMLVREDDPTAGYLIGVEASNVARAINSHDALVTALAQMVAVFDHPKLSTPADRAMARIAIRAALETARGEA